MGAMSDFMPYVGLGLSSVSTGISTAAAYRDAQADNMAAEMNAITYQQNAELSRIRADNFRKLGDIEAADVRREYESMTGEQRAAYGASGVNVNAGSAAAVVANTAAEGVYEANKTKYGRALQAWEAEQEAANLDNQAAITLATKRNPWVPAASAAVGGMTNMYSTYGNWKK